MASIEARLFESKELKSTLTDLKILAGLARYHAVRIPGGVEYALFEQTRDVTALDRAIRHEKDAIAAWEQIVNAAGDVYAPNLIFGLPRVGLAGHWKDELEELRGGLAALEHQRAPQVGTTSISSTDGRRVVTEGRPNGRYEIRLYVEAKDKPVGPMWIEAGGLDRTETFKVKPGEHVSKTLRTTVVDGKLHIAFDTPAGGSWSASSISVSPIDPLVRHAPIRRARPGSTIAIEATAADSASLRVRFQSQGIWRSVAMTKSGAERWAALIHAPEEYFIEATDSLGEESQTPHIRVTLSNDHDAPAVIHTPVTRVEKSAPLVIRAHAEDPSGIRIVRVRYRAVSQYQDFRSLEMLRNADGEFTAEIPAAHIDSRYDLMYFIEAIDNAGNGKIYPDLEKQTPYTIVKVGR